MSAMFHGHGGAILDNEKLMDHDLVDQPLGPYYGRGVVRHGAVP